MEALAIALGSLNILQLSVKSPLHQLSQKAVNKKCVGVLDVLFDIFGMSKTTCECCFGAGDCEGPVRPGPVLCVNVSPFLWLVFYFSPPVIMSCCFVLVFYGLSPDCFL